MTTNVTPPQQGFVLGNGLYDRLKFLTQIVLPALGVLYLSLSQVWGFPRGEEVVGSITAVVLFLGVVLGISSSRYSAETEGAHPVGNFIVDTDAEGRTSVRLELETDPEEFIGNGTISFRTSREENSL